MLVAFAAIVAAVPVSQAQEIAPGLPILELHDGDRIVFVGSNFFEREYRFGVIEAALTVAHPDKHLTFRNLGWSGDNVWGDARNYFEERPHGYDNLIQSVKGAQPTVIFLAYGQNESFAGPEGLPAFTEQYNKLIDELQAVTDRIFVFTPIPVHAGTSPLTAQQVHAQNTTRKLYVDAITDLAVRRQLPVFDFYGPLIRYAEQDQSGITFSKGTDLTREGYFVVGTLVRAVSIPTYLFERHDPHRIITAEEAEGRAATGFLAPGDIHRAILKKNQLFFHSWRPANITYLTLFRKHEQGNNAVEVEQFKPLIEQAERDIADLRAQLNSAANQPANNGN